MPSNKRPTRPPLHRYALEPRLARVRVEQRADGVQVLTGYGAVFYNPDDPGTEYRMWPDLVERIMPTAFAAALAEGDDVRSFFNHDEGQVLGRSASGTLRLSTDQVGLRYEVDLPRTGAGPIVAELVERGDVPGSSFQFIVGGPQAKRGRVVWAEEKQANGLVVDVRELHDVDLREVGPVMWPAYATGSPDMRAAADLVDHLARERDAHRRQLAGDAGPTADEVAVRLRMLDL